MMSLLSWSEIIYHFLTVEQMDSVGIAAQVKSR